MAKHKTLDGTGTQKCSVSLCPFWSIAGLIRGQGFCPFHWAAHKWGLKWALQCHPTYVQEKPRYRQDRGL